MVIQQHYFMRKQNYIRAKQQPSFYLIIHKTNKSVKRNS